MAAEHDAAVGPGADAGEEIGLGAVGLLRHGRRDALRGEMPCNPFDQGEIGIAADRVEADQLFQNLRRRAEQCRHDANLVDRRFCRAACAVRKVASRQPAVKRTGQPAGIDQQDEDDDLRR
jgi:hypothetical protein